MDFRQSYAYSQQQHKRETVSAYLVSTDHREFHENLTALELNLASETGAQDLLGALVAFLKPVIQGHATAQGKMISTIFKLDIILFMITLQRLPMSEIKTV